MFQTSDISPKIKFLRRPFDVKRKVNLRSQEKKIHNEFLNKFTPNPEFKQQFLNGDRYKNVVKKVLQKVDNDEKPAAVIVMNEQFFEGRTSNISMLLEEETMRREA